MLVGINLGMPESCECGYETKDENWVRSVWPCPCYDAETQSCMAFVPHRELYNPAAGIDELSSGGRPAWCPLVEFPESVKFF